jgi:Chlamydia polymorphic membrane protein (Chlamydia_PMP) repeat
MPRKVNAMAVAAVMAMGTGGALTAQAAQAATAVAVPCSSQALTSAVAGAASGTTLSLAARCVYNLTAALPEVSGVLTITGNRATLQRSYAAGTTAFTILTVAGSGNLTVSDLNFRHGASAIAAIDHGQLTVNGGTFTGNGNADVSGGAIDSNANPYAPQINDATFIGNTGSFGGAIYNYSPLTSMMVTGSAFIGNKAGVGGAIFEYGTGGIIADSTFLGNSAGEGGALYLNENGAEEFTDSVICGNSTNGPGGGIYSGVGGNGVSLDNSTVCDNHAGGQGGGIYVGSGYTVATGSHIQGNSAADGGGIYNDAYVELLLTGSTVSGNYAAADGGGVYNAVGIETDSVKSSTLSGNHAAGHGGGIYNEGFSPGQGYLSLVVSGTRIIHNSAPGGGGGIYDGPNIMLTLTNSAVTGNEPDNCEPPGSITGCTG